MRLLVALCILTVCLVGCGRRDFTLVQLENGAIRGLLEDSVYVWKGIPYAQPPVGIRRWQPPAPVNKWDGVREAHEFGNICPQTGYGEQSIYEIPSQPMSEDCLYLNVWTRDPDPEELRPVFVWIHGGSLTREGGTHPQYLGSNMAKKGLVYVSINYRLNAFGFMAHPELSKESPNDISGNYGLMDQIAALQWIKDNIEAFGGDPGNVTIAGESAGGWSVTVLTAMSKASGLFHKAIAQSGAYLWPGPHLKTAQNGYLAGEEEGRQFMDMLGASSLDEMRALSAEKIKDLFFSDSSQLNSEPLVDGVWLEDEIHKIYASNQHNKVDIITGSNSHEWSLWIPSDLPTDPEVYRSLIKSRYPNRDDLFFEAYPVKDSASIAQAYMYFQADKDFHLHDRNWARHMNKGGNQVYMYYFSRIPKERYPAKYGAFHGAEIVYALNNLGNDPGPIGSGIISKADKDYADAMSNYWVNFATTGNPNGTGTPVHWPIWEPVHEAYLGFDETIRPGNFLLKERLDAVQRFLDAE